MVLGPRLTLYDPPPNPPFDPAAQRNQLVRLATAASLRPGTMEVMIERATRGNPFEIDGCAVEAMR
jgi:hypothetical protein